MNEQMSEVLTMARRYVAKPGNGTGGSLRIILEDINVEDDNIEFCAKHAALEFDVDGLALAEALRDLSITERTVVAGECWWDENGNLIA